jgi:hypothetical protein
MRPKFDEIEPVFRSYQGRFVDYFSCPEELLMSPERPSPNSRSPKHSLNVQSDSGPRRRRESPSSGDRSRATKGAGSLADGSPHRSHHETDSKTGPSRRSRSPQGDSPRLSRTLAEESDGEAGSHEVAVCPEDSFDSSIRKAHPQSSTSPQKHASLERGSGDEAEGEEVGEQWGWVSEATPDKPVHEKSWLMKTRNKLAVSDAVDLSGYHLQNVPEANLAAMEESVGAKLV